MNQKLALAIAGVLTALVLLLMLGVGTTVAVQSLLVSRNAVPQPQAPASDTLGKAETGMQNSVIAKLTVDQAAQIALNAAPNSKVSGQPELVNLQDTVAYQVLLNNGNVVYVDANNGAVLFNSATANGTFSNSGSQRRSHEQSEHEEGDHDD